jgi:hypothetical protein
MATDTSVATSNPDAVPQKNSASSRGKYGGALGHMGSDNALNVVPPKDVGGRAVPGLRVVRIALREESTRIAPSEEVDRFCVDGI